MTRVLASIATLMTVSFVVFGSAPTATGQTGQGWIQLFNGKNLDGWTPTNDAVNWRVEDGILVADKTTSKGGNHLVTKNSYKDHQIYAEFWASDDANSGIFFRISDPKRINAKSAYEANIFDTRPDPSYGTGAIVNFAEVNPMPKAGGKWNIFEISAKGRHLTVMMNGKKTSEVHSGYFVEGPFSLQYGTGVIKWRKVAVRPL